MSDFLPRLPVTMNKNREGNLLIPLYFTSDDGPWIRNLLMIFNLFEGKSKEAWRKHLSNGLNFKLPYQKGRFAIQFIENELTTTQEPPPNLEKVKIEVFIAATTHRRELVKQISWDRKPFRQKTIDSILKENSSVSMVQLDHSLSTGTGRQTFLKSISTLGEPSDLPKILNGALIKKIMMRSFIIEILVTDQCRRLVRQAKLRGLVCEVLLNEDKKNRLRISGPLAIFGPTTLYGRRLQEFIPLLFWSLDFKLKATFHLQGSPHFLYLDSSSPLKVANPPKFFDSKLEEKFFQEFGKYTQVWDLYREPAPFALGRRMFFPDFLAVSKNKKNSSVYIEIVGYWTEDYLKKKLEDIAFLKNNKALFIISHKLKDHFASPYFNHRYIFIKRKIPIQDIVSCLKDLE